MSDVAAGSVLGAGNPAPAVAAAGGESAPVADGWVSSLPESVRGVVLNKGWKAPEDAITSYANLEKLLGADKAGRGVVLPKDDAGADEWGQFWNRLGRPEAADQYNIPLPDGDDGGFAKQAATWFHEAGLTQRQAEGLAGKWNEFATGMQRQQDREAEDQQDQGQTVGRGIIQRLDMVIDLHRGDTGFAGQIAAQHQHHAKLAHRMGKAQNGRGDEAGARQGQSHGKKPVQRAGAQRSGGFQRARADGLECALQGLHRKRQ